MLRHLTGASAVLLLLYWITHVSSSRSVIVGLGMPVVGTVLAFVWAFWTLSERISARAQPQVLGLEELELLKEAIRRKREAGSAAEQAHALAANVVNRLPPPRSAAESEPPVS